MRNLDNDYKREGTIWKMRNHNSRYIRGVGIGEK